MATLPREHRGRLRHHFPRHAALGLPIELARPIPPALRTELAWPFPPGLRTELVRPYDSVRSPSASLYTWSITSL